MNDELDPLDQFVGYTGGIGYVYTMILGGFDVSTFLGMTPGFMWILFVLCTVLVMIIMMNLLIAIISQSFSDISSVSQEASYRERAKIISENLYLVPWCTREFKSPQNSYVLMAVDVEKESLQNEESIDFKLKTLKKRIKEEMRLLQGKNKKTLNKHHEEILKLLR